MLVFIYPQGGEANASKDAQENPVRFSKEMRGTFNQKKMSYLASHYETIIYEKNTYENPMASIFVTEYRTLKNDPKRPVIFIFNGGPGSASLWLHMGVLGPKVVKVPSDATDDGSPPYNLIDNNSSPVIIL